MLSAKSELHEDFYDSESTFCRTNVQALTKHGKTQGDRGKTERQNQNKLPHQLEEACVVQLHLGLQQSRIRDGGGGREFFQ